MTQIEAAKKIIEQNGSCQGVLCSLCPVDCLTQDFLNSKIVDWLKDWLKEREETHD